MPYGALLLPQMARHVIEKIIQPPVQSDTEQRHDNIRNKA
jgi:hypothetical protein